MEDHIAKRTAEVERLRTESAAADDRLAHERRIMQNCIRERDDLAETMADDPTVSAASLNAKIADCELRIKSLERRATAKKQDHRVSVERLAMRQ